MRGAWAIWLCVAAASLSAQQSFEAEFRQGLLALNNQDFVTARQSLETAAHLQPDHALVWAALADTYLRSKQPKPAHESAERAAKLAPADPSVQHALAMFYAEAGEFAKAADWEQRFATGKTADVQAPARVADLFLRAGDALQAVAWAKTALHRDDSARTHHLLGQAYAAANQADNALAEFQRAVERDPGTPALVFDLGQMQLRRGDFSGALRTLEEGCRRFPQSAQLQLAYGVAAYGQRKFGDAIDAFLRVTRIDSSVEQPYVFLARILDQAGDRMPQIVAAYAAWEKTEPRNYIAACLHAKAMRAAGEDPAEIERELRRSIALNDRYWESHFELGALLAKRHEWDAAAAELSRSITLDPRQAPAHFQLARVYDRLGKPDLAQAERAEHERLTAAETGAEPR